MTTTKTTQTASPKAAPKAADKPAPVQPTTKPCDCSRYQVEVEAADPEAGTEGVYTGTGCSAVLAAKSRTSFRPGHDAKLKGLLLKAGRAGQAVLFEEGSLTVTTDALGVASRYGFGKLVQAGLEATALKAEAKKETTPEPEAAPVAVPEAAPEAPVKPARRRRTPATK